MRTTTSMLAVGALVAGGALLTAPAAHAAPPIETVEYVYDGAAPQLFIVPVGVTSVDYVVRGGAGGTGGGTNGGAGGSAHEVTGSLVVTAGQMLSIFVAQPGSGGLDDVSVPLPGVGGWGYTSGGDGGFGSALSRPGGGGGGSSAIVVDGTVAVVGAGGGGGGGRGIVGFCFGGDGGDGDVNGAPGLAADDCLIPGLGGLTDQGLNGDGTDGGDVILFGGGGGGGGAGAPGQGGGGGFAGAHPGVPVNLGAGGGGGAGGGSVLTDPDGVIQLADPTDVASVELSYAPTFATSVAPTPAGTHPFGEGVEVFIAVTNTTVPAFLVTDGTVRLSAGGTELATADVVNGIALLAVGELPAGELEFDLEYLPEAVSPFLASTGEGSLVVAKGAVTLAADASPNPNAANVGVDVTADIAGVGTIGPTGALVLVVDGDAVQSVELDGDVSATIAFEPLTLAAGDHDIEVLYAGDDNYLSATSETIVQRTTALPAPPAPALPNTGLEVTGAAIAGGLVLLAGLGMLAARRIRVRRSTLTP